MKELFQSFANYNSSVNQTVIELLKPLRKEVITLKNKAYFQSIFETFLHNFIADQNWLRNNKDALKENRALRDTRLISLDDKRLRNEFESDYKKLFQYRRELDDVIIQFINELDESELNRVFMYKNDKGEDVGKELWKTLLHWFNHQTHHRGQLSVLLDLIGVDHDYSAMVMRI